MTRLSTPAGGSSSGADDDIYTVLIVVAFLFVLTAIVYVGYRAQTLFGQLLPPPGG